jgi:hypothetical protein
MSMNPYHPHYAPVAELAFRPRRSDLHEQRRPGTGVIPVSILPTQRSANPMPLLAPAAPFAVRPHPAWPSLQDSTA